jgi:DNA repair exonuclease SbcCD ATPase subunit
MNNMAEEIYEMVTNFLTDLFIDRSKTTLQELKHIKDNLPEYERKIEEIKESENKVLQELSTRVNEYLNKDFRDPEATREYFSKNLEAFQKYLNVLANKDENVRKMLEKYNSLRSEKNELERKIKLAEIVDYLPVEKVEKLLENPPKGEELYKKIIEITFETMKNYLKKRNREREKYGSIIIFTILSFLSLSTLISFFFLFSTFSPHSMTAQTISYNFLSPFSFVFSLTALILFLMFLKIQRRNY